MPPKDSEESILQQQIDFSNVQITFLGLYHYATTIDIVLLSICAIAAILAGACQPIPTVTTHSHFPSPPPSITPRRFLTYW